MVEKKTTNWYIDVMYIGREQRKIHATKNRCNIFGSLYMCIGHEQRKVHATKKCGVKVLKPM